MFGWLSLQLNWICSWSLDMMLWYLSFFERCLCTKTLSVDSVTDCSEAARQLSMVLDTASFISKWWRNSVRKGYFNRKCIYKWNPDGANKRKVFVFYINYHWINRYEMVCNTNARDTPPKNENSVIIYSLSCGSKSALHFFLLRSTKENVLSMLGTK